MNAVPNVLSPPPLPSISVKICAYDNRCRYWAKVVPAGHELPLPSEVSGAADIPGPYLPARSNAKLFPGDVLFQGEANHHSRTDRGWTYWVTYVDASGKQSRFKSGFGPQKLAAKAQGLAPELLAGSGDVAGAVRVAHALRAGLKLL